MFTAKMPIFATEINSNISYSMNKYLKLALFLVIMALILLFCGCKTGKTSLYQNKTEHLLETVAHQDTTDVIEDIEVTQTKLSDNKLKTNIKKRTKTVSTGQKQTDRTDHIIDSLNALNQTELIKAKQENKDLKKQNKQLLKQVNYKPGFWAKYKEIIRPAAILAFIFILLFIINKCVRTFSN